MMSPTTLLCRLAVVVALAFATVAAPVAALAQPSSRDLAGDLFRRGVEAFNDGRYTEAAQLLIEAWNYDPNARLAFNVGRAWERAENPANARVWYEIAIDSSDDAEITRQAREGLARVAPGSVPPADDPGPTVAAPSGSLFVAAPIGIPTARGQIGAADPSFLPIQVDLPPGPVVVRVTADGHAPFEQTVTIEADGSAIVEPRLVPLRDGSTLRMAGWVTGGVGVAALAGGLLAYLQTASLHDEATTACGRGDRPACKQARDSGRTAATTSTVLYSLGAIALTSGIVMLFLGADDEAAPAREPRSAGNASRGAFLEFTW